MPLNVPSSISLPRGLPEAKWPARLRWSTWRPEVLKALDDFGRLLALRRRLDDLSRDEQSVELINETGRTTGDDEFAEMHVIDQSQRLRHAVDLLLAQHPDPDLRLLTLLPATPLPTGRTRPLREVAALVLSHPVLPLLLLSSEDISWATYSLYAIVTPDLTVKRKTQVWGSVDGEAYSVNLEKSLRAWRQRRGLPEKLDVLLNLIVPGRPNADLRYLANYAQQVQTQTGASLVDVMVYRAEWETIWSQEMQRTLGRPLPPNELLLTLLRTMDLPLPVG